MKSRMVIKCDSFKSYNLPTRTHPSIVVLVYRWSDQEVGVTKVWPWGRCNLGVAGIWVQNKNGQEVGIIHVCPGSPGGSVT